jgi:hypothetical protein
MLTGDTKPAEGATNLVNAALGAFNPLGGESDLVQQASPTLFDPVVQHITNRNFAGNPIRPEPFPGGAPKPDSQMAFRSVSPTARSVAQGLNRLTGGDAATSGAIDVSPETVEHVVSFLTGGVGRFVAGTADTGARLVQGEEIPVGKTPFLKRFVYEAHPSEMGNRYRENLTELEALEERYKLYKKSRDTAKINALPLPLLRAKQTVDNIEGRIRKLRKAEREGRAVNVDEQIRSLQARANRLIEGARKAAARRAEA